METLQLKKINIKKYNFEMWHKHNFDYCARFQKSIENKYHKIFDDIAGGLVPLAFWDGSPVVRRDGVVSVMRYALHKSPKKEGYLQLSVMEILDGVRVVPCYDCQFATFDEFRKETGCRDGVLIRFIA